MSRFCLSPNSSSEVIDLSKLSYCDASVLVCLCIAAVEASSVSMARRRSSSTSGRVALRFELARRVCKAPESSSFEYLLLTKAISDYERYVAKRD